MKNHILFVLALAILFFGCINLDVPASPDEEDIVAEKNITPSFSIVYPSKDSRIEVGNELNTLEILLKTSDISLKAPSINNKLGEGHFVVKLDDKEPVNAYQTSIMLENVALGVHTLIIEFVQNDGSSYFPKIVGEISFELFAKQDMAYTPKTYEVNLENNTFVPKEITIKKTDTIKFTNLDPLAHAIKIEGVVTLSPLSKGSSISYAFETPGEYEMYSLTIPTVIGKIVVNE